MKTPTLVDVDTYPPTLEGIPLLSCLPLADMSGCTYHFVDASVLGRRGTVSLELEAEGCGYRRLRLTVRPMEQLEGTNQMFPNGVEGEIGNTNWVVGNSDEAKIEKGMSNLAHWSERSKRG